MTPCTPAPPCDLEYPLFCEPLEVTAIAKRLVVEDSSACEKTLQTPPSGQVLISNTNGTISWTNGANNAVLRKTSTGSVEFATSNTILQSGPVNLGSQPLTTTGTLSSRTITTTSVTATGAINGASVTATGAVNGESAVFNRNSSSDTILVTQTGSGSAIYANGKIRSSDSILSEQSFLSQTGIFTNYEGNDYIKLDPSDDSIRFFSNNNEKVTILESGNVGIGTTTPAKKLHVNGTVRLQGLPVYANNAAAITGGLAAGDLFIANVSGEGQLRIVI